MLGASLRDEREDDPRQPEFYMVGGGASDSSDDSLPTQFSIPSIAEAIWKQRKAITLIWLVVTIVAAVGIQFLPPVFEAEALVLLEPQRIPHDFVSPTRVGADLWERLNSLDQRVLSHTQLISLIETFDLYREEAKRLSQEELVEEMREDIRIQLEQGLGTSNRPPAFRVAYSGPNPEQVAQVANRLAYLFIEQDLRERSAEAVGTAEFLDSQLEEARQELEEQETRLSRYKTEHNGELPEQEGALLGTLARLQAQLQTNQEAIRQAQQDKFFTRNALEEAKSSAEDLRSLTNRQDSRLGGAVPTEALAALEDPTIRDMRQLRRDLIVLRQRYTESHPEVVKAKETLKELEAAARDLEKGSPSESEALDGVTEGGAAGQDPAVAFLLEPEMRRRQEQISQLQTQLKSLDNRIDMLQSAQQRLTASIATAEYQINRLPLREQEIASLVRDYDITRTNYQSLLRKKKDADIAMEMEKRQKSEKFVLLDAARVPTEPVHPQVLLLSLAGSVFGLVFGAVVGLGRELRNNVLLGEWELPGEMNVMGRVPDFAVGSPAKTPLSFRRLVVASSILLVLAALGIGAVGLRAWPTF